MKYQNYFQTAYNVSVERCMHPSDRHINREWDFHTSSNSADNIDKAGMYVTENEDSH